VLRDQFFNEVSLEKGRFFAGSWNLNNLLWLVEGVPVGDIRQFHVVEDEVGGGQHVGQRLPFPAPHLLADGLPLLHARSLLLQLLNHTGEEAARATGGVEHHLTEPGRRHVRHELRDGPWRVELPVGPGALQFLEDALVNLPEKVPLGGHVEVNLVQLVHHLAQVGAALHIVVVALEHLPHHERAGVVRRQVPQCREQPLANELLQLVPGDALGIGRPVASRHMCRETPSARATRSRRAVLPARCPCRP
jgi:hypothetical protein